MQTQSNNDQLPQDGTQTMTAPVGREDSSGEQNVVNSQDQDQPVNGGDDELEAGTLQNGGEDPENEEGELEEEDFEVDEKDIEEGEEANEGDTEAPLSKE